MDGEWVSKLDKAKGRSEYVIIVHIDIRGFTDFCQTVDSVNVATYIKKVYQKIINQYFTDVIYSKPMGDGLFLVIPFDEENVEALVNDVIDRCNTLINNFSILVSEDKMITFPTPSFIGIGLTRGSACCIYVDEEIIDYSGKILNLASRLMNLARPSGLVCDFDSINKILKPELKEVFAEEEVYVRSIAEREPIKILYLKDNVIISDIHKKPLDEPIWEIKKITKTVGFIKKSHISVLFPLDLRPSNFDDIYVRVIYPHYKDGVKYEGHSITTLYKISDHKLNYVEEGTNFWIRLYLKELLEKFEEIKIDDEEEVQITIQYPT